MPGPIEFSTERLRLRQWNSSDVEPFAALNADPRVMEFFPSVLTPEASAAMVEYLKAQIEERGWGLWVAQLLESGHFIGFVGLHLPAVALPFGHCVEVGWRLAFSHWGKGLASEAARGALRVGFEQLKLPEIVSYTAVGNLRSRAVMARLSMHNAEKNFEHPNVPEGSPVREHCLYRLSQAQWRSNGT